MGPFLPIFQHFWITIKVFEHFTNRLSKIQLCIISLFKYTTAVKVKQSSYCPQTMHCNECIFQVQERVMALNICLLVLHPLLNKLLWYKCEMSVDGPWNHQGLNSKLKHQSRRDCNTETYMEMMINTVVL